MPANAQSSWSPGKIPKFSWLGCWDPVGGVGCREEVDGADTRLNTLTSTKRRPGEVRTNVEVGSEEGSEPQRMCSRIEMLPMLD